MEEFPEFTDNPPEDVIYLPMVPIRDVVVFPNAKAAFTIGRESSVLALEQALRGNRMIFLAAQHDATVEEPGPDEIYDVGTIALISNSLRKPDEPTIKVLVEGRERAHAIRVIEKDGYLQATVRRAPVIVETGRKTNSLVTRIHALVEQYLKLAQEPNPELLNSAVRMAKAIIAMARWVSVIEDSRLST